MAPCVMSAGVKADFAAGENAAKLHLYDEAFAELLPVAQSGHAIAQLYVANMYRRGYGVQRDLASSALWSRRAAEQGQAAGLHNQAVHLRDGAGVRADQQMATKWFTGAARAGHSAVSRRCAAAVR